MKITKQNIKYIIIDSLIVAASILLSLMLRFDAEVPSYFTNMVMKVIPFIIIFKILVNMIVNIYTIYWPTASVNEALLLGFAVAASSIILLIFFRFKRFIPMSTILISSVIEIIFMGLVRFFEKYEFQRSANGNAKRKVLIIGAGHAGINVYNEVRQHREFGRVVGFIDDDLKKRHVVIKGVKVLGSTDEIVEVSDKYDIDTIIFAIPSISKKRRTEILEICKNAKAEVKIVPGIYELINGQIEFSQIRDVSIDDLLGRDQIKLDTSSLEGMIKDRTILVTGGGGSIGSELCRQIAKYFPRKLVILDIYENNAYEIQLELVRNHPELDLEVCIESIRDRKRMKYVFDHYRPDIVFHAAAHKHVPLMEDSYISAIKNNVLGTKNLLDMADKFKVKRFVNISTDKAVNPTNVMGATKRIIEIMLQTINNHSETEFVAVRFGNVLGSNGSVIPLFKKQIKEGGPVTVTHKDIIRYFMTIPEACQLVLQAGAIATGGQIFILDMGEPVKILDLAENLIKLSGYTPYEDIKIEFTGLRPGEKLYEELLLNLENSDKTEFEKIYIEKPVVHDEEKLNKTLEKFKLLVEGSNKQEILDTIKDLVPEFNHKENR